MKTTSNMKLIFSSCYNICDTIYVKFMILVRSSGLSGLEVFPNLEKNEYLKKIKLKISR